MMTPRDDRPERIPWLAIVRQMERTPGIDRVGPSEEFDPAGMPAAAVVRPCRQHGPADGHGRRKTPHVLIHFTRYSYGFAAEGQAGRVPIDFGLWIGQCKLCRTIYYGQRRFN